MRLMRSVCCAALLATSAVRPAASQSDSSAAPSRSVRDGAYTAEQAGRGQAVFREVCGTCHAPSQFTGPTFVRAWAGRTAYDLFSLIRTSMPFDNPASLSREQYADVVTYLFRLNGFPAGDRELPAGDDGLKRVRVEALPDSTGKP